MFVSFQVKQNTHELKNSHFENVVQRINNFHARTYDKDTAAILRKGQESYAQLAAGERLAFESWMHEFVLG